MRQQADNEHLVALIQAGEDEAENMLHLWQQNRGGRTKRGACTARKRGAFPKQTNRKKVAERRDFMSVRIRISYTEDEELDEILRRLSDLVKISKVAKKQEGAYRNAYVLCTHFPKQHE